jgi:hypothetical protein
LLESCAQNSKHPLSLPLNVTLGIKGFVPPATAISHATITPAVPGGAPGAIAGSTVKLPLALSPEANWETPFSVQVTCPIWAFAEPAVRAKNVAAIEWEMTL